MLLAMLAVLGVTLVVGLIGALLGGGFRPQEMTPGTLEFSVQGPGEAVANLLGWIVNTFVMGVAAKAALEVTEGQPFDFFGALKRVNLVRLLIASVLVGVAVLIGFCLLVIPGLIVLFLTYLTTYSLVDDDKSPIDAIKHSFQLVSSNVGDALILAILNILVIIAGLIALCVGVFVAIPVTIFATAYAYRTFNGQPVAA